MTQSAPQAGRPSNSLHYAVGELSGKVDAIRLDLMPRLTDVEQRVTTLEQWQWRSIGGGGVILFLVGSWEVIQHVIRR